MSDQDPSVRLPCLRIPTKSDCECLPCSDWRAHKAKCFGMPAADLLETDKAEAAESAEALLWECESLGCTTRVGTKIGGKAACLKHVRELTTVEERRESLGLDPKMPPPGGVYTDEVNLSGTQTGRFSSKEKNLSNLPKISLGGQSVEAQPVEGYRVVIQTRLKEEEWVRDLVKAVRGVAEGLADKTLISVDRLHTDPDDGYVWTLPMDPLKPANPIGGPSVVDRLADPLLAKFASGPRIKAPEPTEKE